MRIAHISDTHLGLRQYNLDERENDVYRAFEQAIDRVIEERVDVLIHSGDLFDSPTPPIKALYVFKNTMKRLNGKVRIYTVLGDHDRPKRRGMPPHKLFDLRVLGVGGLEWEEVDGILIAGISNLRGRMAELLKEELKKFDQISEKYRKSILIAHQAIDRFLPFEGDYELKEDDLPGSATYYAFGHIHSRQTVKFGRGLFAYSGSIEITRRDEIPSWMKDGKGFYIVDLEGDEPSVEKVDLEIRPQLEVELEDNRIGEILNQLNTRVEPILHITVRGGKLDRAQIYEKLKELLAGRVLEFRIRFEFEDVKKAFPELPRGQISIEELIRRYLQDEELSKLAVELFKSLSQEDIDSAKNIAQSYLEAVLGDDSEKSQA